jgi:O-antigen ligase
MMLAAAGVLAVAYVPQTLIERLATTQSEVQGGRFGGRGKLWEAGLEVFPANPVFGVGIGGYKAAITPVLGPAAQVAHNSYLSVLIEHGIVGFVLYMMMFVAAFRSILKLPVLERRFALVLLATLVIAMLPLTWEDRRPAWFVLAALIGFSHVQIAARGGAPRQPSPGRAAPPLGRPRATRQPERLTARVQDDGGDPTE